MRELVVFRLLMTLKGMAGQGPYLDVGAGSQLCSSSSSGTLLPLLKFSSIFRTGELERPHAAEPVYGLSPLLRLGRRVQGFPLLLELPTAASSIRL